MSANSEDIVQKITGNFGRWQLRTIVLVYLTKIPAAWFMACISYTAPLPKAAEYYCKPNAITDNTTRIIDPWIRKSYPLEKDEQKTDRAFEIDKCYVYRNSDQYNKNYTNPFAKPLQNGSIEQIMPCDHFEHNAEYESLVTQFDLVCSRQLLVSVTQSFHSLGGLVGGLMALHLLKYISPKRLMLYGMIGQIICGNLTGLVSTYTLHVYYRFLTSVFCGFMIAGGQNIMSDITAGKARTIAVTLSELFSAVGLILLPGMAIFFDSWSSLYIAMSSSLLFLVYPLRWTTDSPRWLLKHNKIDETIKILLESAAFNGREIPLDLDERLELLAKNLQNKPNPSYWSIWDGVTPRRYIFRLHWAWSVSTMMLMIRFIGVDRMFASTFPYGFAEMLGIILGLCLILYTRRRWLLSGYLMIFPGILTYFLWLLPDTIKETRKNGIEFAFWLILKMVNSSALVLLTACSGELVSPEKRPILNISTATFSRFWLTIAPFSLALLKVHRLIPITIYASAVITSGLVMCLFNAHFRNEDQPKVCAIPTPNTYRRKCSMISQDSGCDNPAMTISMEELWETEDQIEEELEEELAEETNESMKPNPIRY